MKPLLVTTALEQVRSFCIVNTADAGRVRQFEVLKAAIPRLEQFPAIMGKNLGGDELIKYMADGLLDKRSVTFSLQGEIGCFLSHVRLLKDISGQAQGWYLVLEDDVALVDNFQGKLSDILGECDGEVDILYLFHAEENPFVTGSAAGGIARSREIWKTLGYAVSPKGAQKIVRAVCPMRGRPIDQSLILANYAGTIDAWASLAPLLINRGDIDRFRKGRLAGSVQQSGLPEKLFWWQRLARALYPAYFFPFCLPLFLFLPNKFLLKIPLADYGMRRHPSLERACLRLRALVKRAALATSRWAA